MKRVAVLLALLVGLWPTSVHADNPFTDWVRPEVRFVEEAMRELDSEVRRARTDEAAGQAFVTFRDKMLEGSILRPWKKHVGDLDLCVVHAARWDSRSYGGGIDCEYWRWSLKNRMEETYDALIEYSRWMEVYYDIRGLTNVRYSDWIRLSRAEPIRQYAETTLAQFEETASFVNQRVTP